MSCWRGEQPKGCLAFRTNFGWDALPRRVIPWKRVGQRHQSFSIGAGEPFALRVRVFDAAQQGGGVIEMPVSVAGIGLVGSGFEDERTERVGHAYRRRLAGDDFQAGVDGATEGLGSAFDLHHCAPA